jgi:hypothetical protein
VGDRAQAEDILQEAFVRGMNKEALRKQLQRSCGTCAEHGCLDCTSESSSGHRA